MKGLCRKIKDTFQSIRDNITAFVQKKDRLLAFVRDEAHVGAFRKVKGEAFKLLKRLNPSKLTASLRFGFEDPCTTGQVLAGLAVLYPFLGEHVQVSPEFENRVLEGQVYVKGKIYGYYFFLLCWNLIWCRHVRTTFKDVKNFQL